MGRLQNYINATTISSIAISLFLVTSHAQAATFAPPKDAGAATTTTEVITTKKVAPMLNAKSSDLARAAVDRYVAIVSEGGWEAVPRGTYKRNAKGKGVAALNRRLFIEGYVRAEAVGDEFINFYTAATEQGVARFQRNLGLAVSGKVDPKTLAQLNVPADVRLRTLQANLARIDVYSKDLGERYLLVNVPSQTIEAVNGGRVNSRHNAIVGRPERPTPVVMTPLEMVRFNPYWNAPVSIVEADIFPKLKVSTKVLEDMNMKIFKGYNGPEVDPTTVDWSSALPDDYHFRQEPGPESAMASAKIEFKSPFGIYLHDTPEKQLFKSGYRLYSSGCVRVEQMPALVKWVMNGQDGFGEDKIAAVAETLERIDAPLQTPPQLRVMYLTAWPTADGTVAFRNDVYELDSSGFTVGQPMPVGQLSDDGLRYVLKPVPRLASQIDAAEAEGFGMFKKRKAGLDDGAPVTIFGAKKKPTKNPDLVSSNEDDLQLQPAPKKQKSGIAGVQTKPAKPETIDFATKSKTTFSKTVQTIVEVEKTPKIGQGSKIVSLASEQRILKTKKVVKTATTEKPSVGTRIVGAPSVVFKTTVKSDVKKKTVITNKSCNVGLFATLPAGCKAPAKKKVVALKVKAKPAGKSLTAN